MAIPAFQFKDIASVLIECDADRLADFLQSMDHRVRKDGGFTAGVFKRLADAEFKIRPNWFVLNKATCRIKVKTSWITISMTGDCRQLTPVQVTKGCSLTAWCNLNKFEVCSPWITQDMDGNELTLVAWKLNDNVRWTRYCLTTLGFCWADEDGVIARFAHQR